MFGKIRFDFFLQKCYNNSGYMSVTGEIASISYREMEINQSSERMII